MWSAIYKAKVFNNVRFAKGKYYEDGPVSLEVLFYTDKALILHTAFYNYRKNREGSITQGKPERLFDENDILEELKVKYANIPTYIQAINNYSIEQLMYMYVGVSNSPQSIERQRILKRAAEIAKSRRGTKLLAPGLIKKLRYKIFVFSPHLFGLLSSIGKKIREL